MTFEQWWDDLDKKTDRFLIHQSEQLKKILGIVWKSTSVHPDKSYSEWKSDYMNAGIGDMLEVVEYYGWTLETGQIKHLCEKAWEAARDI